MSIVRKTLVSFTALAVWLTAGLVHAQTHDSSWRLGRKKSASPQNFAFELRFGPYRPRIDDAFPDDKPYNKVFGDGNQFYIGVELDWQAYRIPWVGTIGPGIGWGYTEASARAKIESDRSKESAENTFLRIMPMYVAAVLRVDVLAREANIPIVPYGKLGLGYGLYWCGNDLETQCQGRTVGAHYAFGAMAYLNALDPNASMQLDNETGINGAYVFIEWMGARLDGFASKNDKSVVRIGSSTWVAGLAFEF